MEPLKFINGDSINKISKEKKLRKWGKTKNKKSLKKINSSRQLRKSNKKTPVLKNRKWDKLIYSDQASKISVKKIDYNNEVSQILDLFNTQQKIDWNWRSDASDSISKKETQTKIQHFSEVSENNQALSSTKERRKTDIKEDASFLPNTWLDDLWDESFDAFHYLSSCSEIMQDFFIDSELERKDFSTVKLNSLSKALNIENESSFEDVPALT